MKTKKKRIAETAMGLFLANGYRNTAMQDIADACGMSKGAVYLHFKSKKDLLLAIVILIDEGVQERVRAISQDPGLSDREKLREQIRFQLGDLAENRAILELFIKEGYSSLNEEMMAHVEKCRYRWQRTQEDFLLALYGETLRPFLIDAAAILTGILTEYHAIQLLEKLEIEPDRLSTFIVQIMDIIAAGLGTSAAQPVLEAHMMPNRERLEQELGKTVYERVAEILEAMGDTLEELGLEELEEQEAAATLSVLNAELAGDNPNRLLVQGMLANLRHIQPLAEARERIARLLDIKLL